MMNLTTETKILGAIIVSTIVLFVGGVVFTTRQEGERDAVLSEVFENVEGHSKGNPDAENVIIKYSDFQCPACAIAYPSLDGVVEQAGDRVRVVYKHFPLTSIHRNALNAGYASEAAAEQGEFWAMHDKLFQNQQIWSNLGDPLEEFTKYAEDIGLDIEKFEDDYASDAVRQRVQKDLQEALRLGLGGTPTIFINGTQYRGSYDPNEILGAIN